MSVVTYEIKENIGVISINNPPVKALSHALRAAIQGAINAARTDESKALLLICEGRTFIAGADITECPSSNKWNRRNDYLMESSAHHFHITRRVVGSANDVSRWSFF